MIVGIFIIAIIVATVVADRHHAYLHRQHVRQIDAAYARQQAAFVRITERLQEAIDYV